MSKICFKEKRFNLERRNIIAAANQIIATYSGRISLRQLYYQFVIRNLLPNSERSYKNLGNAISEARLAGLIDWNAIEDRVRIPRKPSEYENLAHLLDSAGESYRLDRWADQENYVEIWVEKDALAGVLSPLSWEYHITLMVNRGYSSQSAMFESAMRFRRAEDSGKVLYLLYVGDHDPSGEDMVRDIRDRLETFGVVVTVHKIALTMAQVEQYNPPPNPAKLSDSRAAAYVEKHGESSWEVDALPPDELESIIRTAIVSLVDEEKMTAVIQREERDKKRLKRAGKRLAKG